MAFFGTQMQRSLPGVIPGQSTHTIEKRIISFNDEIISGGSIITQANGLFTITSSGNFLITWFISLKTGLGESGAYFSLVENHYLTSSPDVVYSSQEYPSTSSMKTGQLSGSALLQIPEGQFCTLGLYNMGDYEAVLSTDTEVNVNITIQPYVVGTYSSSYGLIALELKLDNTDLNIPLLLEYNKPILFNKAKNNAPKIFDYDAVTGTITFKSSGNFMFFWSVNLDGSQDASAISFSLVSNNRTIFTFDNTLIMQHPFSGFAFLTVTANQTFTLVNSSTSSPDTGADVTFSNIATRAILTILGHS